MQGTRLRSDASFIEVAGGGPRAFDGYEREDEWAMGPAVREDGTVE